MELRRDDFYPTFILILLSQFNQKVSYVTGKWLFDQPVFTISSDVKPSNVAINSFSCKINVPMLFN